MEFIILDDLEKEIANHLTEYNQKVSTPKNKNGEWLPIIPTLKVDLFRSRLNKCQLRIDRVVPDEQSPDSINWIDVQAARIRQLHILIENLSQATVDSKIDIEEMLAGVDLEYLSEIDKAVNGSPAPRTRDMHNQTGTNKTATGHAYEILEKVLQSELAEIDKKSPGFSDSERDKQLWKSGKVNGVLGKDLGGIDIKSAKAGLRRRGLGQFIPKPKGGRPNKRTPLTI